MFSLATLTGWGLIWLLLRERHLGGTIILADAHIRYSTPVRGRPSAIADLGSLSGDLDRLARGRKARVQLNVELYGDDKKARCSRASIWYCPPRRKRRWSRAAPKSGDGGPSPDTVGLLRRFRYGALMYLLPDWLPVAADALQ